MIYLFCSQLFDSLLIYKSVTIYSYMVILNFLTLLKLRFIGITIKLFIRYYKVSGYGFPSFSSL